jgi:hypothetical protein
MEGFVAEVEEHLPVEQQLTIYFAQRLQIELNSLKDPAYEGALPFLPKETYIEPPGLTHFVMVMPLQGGGFVKYEVTVAKVAEG